MYILFICVYVSILKRERGREITLSHLIVAWVHIYIFIVFLFPCSFALVHNNSPNFLFFFFFFSLEGRHKYNLTEGGMKTALECFLCPTWTHQRLQIYMYICIDICTWLNNISEIKSSYEIGGIKMKMNEVYVRLFIVIYF